MRLWGQGSFLGQATPGLGGYRKGVAKYADAAMMSQALFRELEKVGRRVTGEWECNIEAWRLLLSETGGFWTEHSERATMASWAHAARIVPEVRKLMGRWKLRVDASPREVRAIMPYV